MTYKKLTDALEKTIFLKEDKKNYKTGDTILIKTQIALHIGKIKETRQDYIELEDMITIKDPRKYNWAIFAKRDLTPKTNTFIASQAQTYKIKNPERVKEITEKQHYAGKSLRILGALQKEVEKTPGYRFLEMSQTLPIELEDMEPEKRLETNKKLEALLEKEIRQTEHTNTNQMLAAKELYKYAKRCGVESTKAKEHYKQKIAKLKKMQKQLKKLIKEMEL